MVRYSDTPPATMAASPSTSAAALKLPTRFDAAVNVSWLTPRGGPGAGQPALARERQPGHHARGDGQHAGRGPPDDHRQPRLRLVSACAGDDFGSREGRRELRRDRLVTPQRHRAGLEAGHVDHPRDRRTDRRVHRHLVPTGVGRQRTRERRDAHQLVVDQHLGAVGGHHRDAAHSRLQPLELAVDLVAPTRAEVRAAFLQVPGEGFLRVRVVEQLQVHLADVVEHLVVGQRLVGALELHQRPAVVAFVVQLGAALEALPGVVDALVGEGQGRQQQRRGDGEAAQLSHGLLRSRSFRVSSNTSVSMARLPAVGLGRGVSS